jgi:hypothetical protein
MSALHGMGWEYFTLKNGVLVDDAGDRVLDAGVRFDSIDAAEAYLEENNIRGSVREVPIETRRYASREEQRERYLDCGPQNWDDRE